MFNTIPNWLLHVNQEPPTQALGKRRWGLGNGNPQDSAHHGIPSAVASEFWPLSPEDPSPPATLVDSEEIAGKAPTDRPIATRNLNSLLPYVRQSTIRQVFENQESTKRQYALRQQAVALGWPVEQIVVIDSDLGQSGASAVDREGFQKLVAEVSLGKAGIVLGLEVSRLARNCADWHRLLEICALMDTLILDEDGLYDPADFNDRLLLGLKGTMSEAELHVLKARLQGGILNKARRGELQSSLPVGFIYSPTNQPILNPDQQVQESLRFLFDSFHRTGSATATIKAFHQQGSSLSPAAEERSPQRRLGVDRANSQPHPASTP